MSSEKNNLFIVDDDESVCRALKILLATYGFNTKSFDCAEEFFSQVPEFAPGCLILDIHLPGMNGWEAWQYLLDSGFKRPVIFITGYENSELMKQACQAGAVGFLQKPFKDQELVDLLHLVQ